MKFNELQLSAVSSPGLGQIDIKRGEDKAHLGDRSTAGRWKILGEDASRRWRRRLVAAAQVRGAIGGAPQ